MKREHAGASVTMGAHTRIGLFSLVDHVGDPSTGLRTSQGQRLRELVEQGVLAEAVGFERFAVGEHHFSDYILPNPSLVLAAIAARTTRIRLFTAVTLISLHDPVRLAEDVATLDALSDGRFEMTVARGVSGEATQAFGLDPDQPYGVMEERLLKLLRMLQSGQAETVGCGDLRLSPLAIQHPHPPIWIGGGLSQGSCDLAARYGLPLILPSLFRYPEDYLPMVDRYREELAARSPVCAPKLGLPSYCWVAKTSQLARQQWEPRIEHYVEQFKRIRSGFGRPMDFESLLRGPAICGSPAEVVDRLGHVHELLGLDNHILLMDAGGMPLTELGPALELMGTHVLPHFPSDAQSTGERLMMG